VDASLKAKSTKLFTLAALYDANRDLLRDYDEDDTEENAKRLADYWSVVADHMTDWKKVVVGNTSAQALRSETIAAHSTVLRALGGLGADLMKEEDWKERLAKLEDIDWSKANREWQNVCIVANSVVSNRQARAATKAFIKHRLGMHLSDAEQRAIEQSPAVQEVA
jgi:DNA sulfur modification protein DndB